MKAGAADLPSTVVLLELITRRPGSTLTQLHRWAGEAGVVFSARAAFQGVRRLAAAGLITEGVPVPRANGAGVPARTWYLTPNGSAHAVTLRRQARDVWPLGTVAHPRPELAEPAWAAIQLLDEAFMPEGVQLYDVQGVNVAHRLLAEAAQGQEARLPRGTPWTPGSEVPGRIALLEAQVAALRTLLDDLLAAEEVSHAPVP